MDTETFKQLFIPFHQKLYRIAFRFLENSSDAEDVVQETYVKLWEKREELNDLLNPEAYCVVLVRNSCMDRLRSVKNRMDTFDPIHHDKADEQSIVAEIENREELMIVEQIIKNLPERQQKVLNLRHIKECSLDEIEQLTGLSAVNIRVLLSRGRKAIREQFNELYNCEKRCITYTNINNMDTHGE